jgi:hypothetical protein
MTPSGLLSLHESPVLNAINAGRLGRTETQVDIARQWCINNLHGELACELLIYVAGCGEAILAALQLNVGDWDDIVICRDNLESALWALGLATIDVDAPISVVLMQHQAMLCVELVEMHLRMSSRQRKGSEKLLNSHPHLRMLINKSDWWIPAAVQAN